MKNINKKRHSAKKKSIKKSSLKKSSLKKSSLKKSSLKKSSLKKSSLKKSSLKNKKIHNKSEYRMKGMGILLNMYGGAISDLEKELDKIKINLRKLLSQYNNEKDMDIKKKLKLQIRYLKKDKNDKKDKINKLLEGISDTTSKAYKVNKTGGDIASKISAFLKTTTEKVGEDISKSVGETVSKGLKVGSKQLSEGIKSVSLSAKDESEKIGDKLKKLNIL
jgi:hypothetical protein